MTKTELFRKAALRAADWYVNSQSRMAKPFWDANAGRFIYDRHVSSGITIWGINWTQARGIFVLLSAWEMTGDEKYLKPIAAAAEYLKILQIYDCPKNPRRQFAIRECTPQTTWSHVRDATEGALAFAFLHRATGDADYLRRAVDYAKWFDANAWTTTGCPACTVHLDRDKVETKEYSFQIADIGLFYYLFKATGERKYLKSVRWIAAYALTTFVREDGSVVQPTHDPHHTSTDGVVLNDDGLMVSMLCAHLALKDQAYLDACLRHAAWIKANVTPPLDLISALPCMCNFMVQLSAVTKDQSHRRWAADAMLKYVLPLQVDLPKDRMADGAFRGEDEPTEHYGPMRKGEPKTNFITTRVTCYAALACFKLAGIVGPYYGATGWERKMKKIRQFPSLAIV